MDIALIAGPASLAIGVAAVQDILATAAIVAAKTQPDLPAITCRVFGEGQFVSTSSGMLIPTDGRLDEAAGADVLVIPGVGVSEESGMISHLAAPAVRLLVETLAGLPTRSTRVAAVCAGTFLLAEAGLATDRWVTTTWWLQRLFRARYPDVRLNVDRMVVRDGHLVTAGAAFAHADLALALIGEVSPGLARSVAGYLVLDHRTAQRPYMAHDHLAAADPLVAAFDRAVTKDLARATPIGRLAASIGTTRRTLERRVREATGLTPLGLIRQHRSERARHLLATTDLSTDRIAHDVGYQNASTLRQLLRVSDGPTSMGPPSL